MSKNILITGSSGYIGKEILNCLDTEGFTITAVTSREFQEVNQLRINFPQVRFLSIRDFHQNLEEGSKFDGIVFAHGINEKFTVKNLSGERAQKIVEINYVYVAEIVSNLLKAKKLNKGASIVFISSISAIHYSVSNAAYSASKAALEAYANTLVLELAPQRIRVNIIRPGLLEGKMKDAYALDDSMNDFIQKIPLKRLGTAQDVANLTIFLLSDKSSWMTGSTIDLDGGIKFT